MRVNIAQSTPPSLSPPPSPHNLTSSSSSSSRFFHLHRSQSSIFGSSLKLSPAKSTAQNLRRSCSASFDGYDFSRPIDDLTRKQNTHIKNNHTTSFRQMGSQLDVLEPSFLGIKPEPPDWPAREELIRDCIARRASSIELPLSLRMIKMKQRFQKLEEEKEKEMKNLNDPIGNLCCSTLCIVKEIQSQALKSRGGDINGVLGKVQKEMTCSFVWLFREVFAKTPELMVQVMVLTSNFATYQLQEKPISEMVNGEDLEKKLGNLMVEKVNESVGFVDDDDHGGGLMELKFVSPVSVEIEGDDYEEYDRTDLLYQIGLSQEPNNTLLLSNYAQFLCLVSRDYDRAEECFKRAIQLDSSDAEIISQYANFLWLVRKDLLGAEERFQQAITAEPNNSYHASKYANFLWSTGGEDTCYPLDAPHSKT